MRQTRGWVAYHKRLEARSATVQEKPKQRKWWFETIVMLSGNLSVWIAGSGIIGQMLENKSAGGVITLGALGIILTMLFVVIVERKTK
ncbi:hypothetical protein FACS189487_10800 [Campylobacterota bacterium]|nr:hypothetical protein FACS189487_10800 [Campylobacterota bacterium]